MAVDTMVCLAPQTHTADRLLAALGTDPPQVRTGKLHILRRFLALHAAFGAVVWAVREPSAASAVIAAAMVTAGAVTFRVRAAIGKRSAQRAQRAETGASASHERAPLAAAALLLVAQMVVRFPKTANHELLGLACLVVLALIDEHREEESALGEHALRWLIPIVFVWSGIQKLLSGCWLQGEFLALNMLRPERFIWFRLVVPRAELAALQALDPASVGSGPYRFESAIPLALANAVWLLELSLPLLLLVRRARAYAALGMIVLLAAIELMAHEVLFGGLCLCLLALFLGEARVRQASVAAALIYGAWLATVVLGAVLG